MTTATNPPLSAIVNIQQLQTYLNQLLTTVADGSAATPSVSFANDTTTGLYRNPTTGNLELVSGGNAGLTIGSSGIVGLQVPTAGNAQGIATKMGQIPSVTDWGVVNDPNQQFVAANTTSYLAAIAATAGGGRLLHPEGLTVHVTPLTIAQPIHLTLDGTLRLANNQNASVINIAGSNITIDGIGTVDGNNTNQQGGVGTVVGGIIANTASTNSARPLPPSNPITINNLLIDGITITNVFNWPISLGYIVNSTVRNCTLSNSHGSPQFIFSAQNCWFNNNLVYNITDGGFVFYQGNYHCGAIGNVVYGCNDGIGTYDDNGSLSANQFITIMGNHVYNNQDSGIGCTTGGTNPPLQQQRINIIGNILHNNNLGGRAGGGSIGIVAAQGVQVQGNVIFGDGNGTTTGNPSYSVFVDALSSFVSITDNIIGDTGALSGTASTNSSGSTPITTYPGQGTGIFLSSPNNCSVVGNAFYNTQGSNGVMRVGVGGGLGAAGTYRDNYLMGAIAAGGFLDELAKPGDLQMQQRGADGSLQVSLGITVTTGNMTVDEGVYCYSNFYGATAQGTTQATAQGFNQSRIIVTNASANAGVIPSGSAATAGGEIVIYNRSGNAITVYPPVGGQIEGLGENVGLSLSNTANLRLFMMGSSQYTGGQWYTELTNAGTGG